MPEDALEKKVEVHVGRRVSGAGAQFIGEKVRFRGKELGSYTEASTIDDSRLKREDTVYVLYRCPGGYRVLRGELHYQRRKERSRWHMKETYTSLLPMVDEEDADQSELTSVYGLYTEEEARRAFPDLFSAVGLPNVRELD